MYPNPIVNELNFGGFPEGFEGEFMLRDINGRMIFSAPITSFDNSVNISQLGLSPGVFIDSVFSEAGTDTYLVMYAP